MLHDWGGLRNFGRLQINVNGDEGDAMCHCTVQHYELPCGYFPRKGNTVTA